MTRQPAPISMTTSAAGAMLPERAPSASDTNTSTAANKLDHPDDPDDNNNNNNNNNNTHNGTAITVTDTSSPPQPASSQPPSLSGPENSTHLLPTAHSLPLQSASASGASASSPGATPTRTSGGYTLRLQTDIYDSGPSVEPAVPNSSPNGNPDSTVASSRCWPSALALPHKTSNSSLRPTCRTPSLKASGFHGFGSSSATSSPVPSPIITAMGDVTPLPSPLLSSDSPGPWKRLGRSPSRQSPSLLAPGMPESALVTSNGESLTAALAHMSKRKAYAELLSGSAGPAADGHDGRSSTLAVGADLKRPHSRNRSISEYIPDPMQLPRRRLSVAASHGKLPDGEPGHERRMRREPNLSEARGLTAVEKPPTPPPSESSVLLGDAVAPAEAKPAAGKKRYEYFEAKGRADGKRRRWRALKLLGQGTFSRVMLATSQTPTDDDKHDDDHDNDHENDHDNANDNDHDHAHDPSAQKPHTRYDRRTLVAVKVCEHGPKGGASEERVEMSLKRELEVMQCIRHPSLVHLKAWNVEPSRAILVLSYCPGGDLFDVASTHRSLLSPTLLARMFSELVGAVRYLHDMHIVHRDIKLENVLVNLTPQELANPSINWTAYPYSVTTLTDLGLSRYVADDEKLETRCGSDDYAAPEVIMGQPYDGRATDAWSLGVLLYALLEGRLPFDPTPGMSDAHRMRSRTSHRIARVEWRWVEYAGDDGSHDGDRARFDARGLLGAMDIAEGLLKRARSRWSLAKVADEAWVRHALALDGGLRFREEEEGEEVS